MMGNSVSMVTAIRINEAVDEKIFEMPPKN